MDQPKWLEIAKKEVGVGEIVGHQNNPRILQYHDETSLNASDDETSWCSSFANWVMKQAGLKGTNNAAARSWLNWGKSIPIPRVGCIVVFERGNSGWQGHVALYINQDDHGNLQVLGGNQGNKVSIANYPKSKLLGYRWPTEKEGYTEE